MKFPTGLGYEAAGVVDALGSGVAGLAPGDAAMTDVTVVIACHTWDTLGAVAAGWEGALIRRPGNDVLGVGPQPQIVGEDLTT